MPRPRKSTRPKPRKVKPLSVTHLHKWLCGFATEGHRWMQKRDTTMTRFPEAQEMFALRDLLGKLKEIAQ